MLRRIGLTVLLTAMVCVGACAQTEELTLHFFDAGKADACLLTTSGSAVLIDSGKNKMGKEIASYLAENGISRLDAMFISHFDKDHVGGADHILEAVEVGKVYEPSYESDSKQFNQYREALEATGTPYIRLSENQTIAIDGIVYQVDVANREDYGEEEENDFSLVISIFHGENSFLFAGDAENPRLSELLAEGIGSHDVLKVPHHGKLEKLSAAFFETVKPKYSIITSDVEDPEDESVVRMLERYGSVYLTREGAITLSSDGRSLSIVQ